MLTQMASARDSTIIQDAPKILIIDDDRDVVASLKDALELELGYKVKVAYNALCLGNMLKNYAPDIALIDVKLGGSSGLDLIPILKNKIPDIVCVMMTAYRNVDYAVKAVRAGADEYLFKPMETDKLLRTVKKFLRIQKKNRARQNSVRNLRTIFKQTSEFIFLLDHKGRILEVDDTALKFLQLERTDVIGLHFDQSPWWRQSCGTEAKVRNALQATVFGREVEFAVELVDNRGKMVWYEFSMKPISAVKKGEGQTLVEGHRISNRVKVDEFLRDLYQNDSLTGLPGRSVLNHQLSKTLASAERHKQSFAVMFIDLDHFKEVNDTLGHQAGDELLVAVTKAMQGCLREEDVITRLGGDEFVVILKEGDNKDAAKTAADRLVRAVAEMHMLAGQKQPVSVSIGVAMYPDDGQTSHTLLKNADKAMYAAKLLHRNCCRFFSEAFCYEAVDCDK